MAQKPKWPEPILANPFSLGKLESTWRSCAKGRANSRFCLPATSNDRLSLKLLDLIGKNDH
jgi:hypothetical protein